MRPVFSLFICILFLLSYTNCKENPSTTSTNPDENWVRLFNGKNLDNWIVKIKGYPLNKNVHNTFRAENGVLSVSYDEYDNFNSAYGHIFYKAPFSSYKLRFQYRFIGNQVAGGADWAYKNSGVMIHSQSPESMALNQDFPVSLEVQLLGGANNTTQRPTGNLCTPGTHVEINNELVTDHCINSTSKTYYDENWVNLEVMVIKDSVITHSINETQVISYSKPIIGGAHNTIPNKEGEALKTGYISLQSESHPIEFRNIELLELKY